MINPAPFLPSSEDALAKQRAYLLQVAIQYTEELRDGQSCAPTALRSIALLEGLEAARDRIKILETRIAELTEEKK